jgi:signal transduction protein with GAF and PtsI domain
LKNKTTGKYDEIVSIGGGAAMLNFVSLSTGNGIAGLTASTRKPIYLPERSRSRHFDPERSFGSLLSIPLLAGEELIGVLNLGAKPTRAFSETAVQLFTALSKHLAIAIERFSLQRDLTGLEQQLEKALEKTEHFTRHMTTLSEIKGSHEERRRALNDVNNALAVIIGSIGTLLYQRSAVDQKMLSQLRRSEQAAVRISSAIGKLDLMINDSSDATPVPAKKRIRD